MISERKWVGRTHRRMSRIPELFLFLLGASVAFAQLPIGTISGTVRDSSGAAIPGATVEVMNRETGLTRTTQTSGNGRYALLALPVGVYEVKAEAASFRSEIQQGLRLEVAQEAVLNFTLSVGSVQETVTVTASAPLVDTTSGSLGGLVNEQRLSDLPLNGRNFNDLVLLQPGINVNVTASPTSQVSIGLTFSSNGAPIRSNYTLLDGANLSGFRGLTGVSISGSMLGVEGIREFRVITNSFPAEYGMTMGSQTTVVSKGGTNEFHGTVFEFLRNSALDARNFFDRKGKPDDPRLPPFRRNNFGGSFGGPIRRDKSFFFATYEGVRERLGLTQVADTINADARRDGFLVPRVAESVKRFLALHPLPTEPLPTDPTGASGIGRLRWQFSQPTKDDFGQVRVDHNFSQGDSLFVRYTTNDTSKVSPLFYPQWTTFGASRGQFITLAENHTFSPTVLNMFRLSYSRTPQNSVSPADPADAFGFPGVTGMGQINISGLSGGIYLGPRFQDPQTTKFETYTLSNDMFWSHGSHTVKLGTLMNRTTSYADFNARSNGTYRFPSLREFLLGNPDQLVILTLGSISDRTYRWYTYGFYVQDDWRATSRFTLNLGLRYEFHTSYNEVKGRGLTLRDPIRDAAFTPGPPLFANPSLRNFGPRLGFAWDVFGNATTAVRGGFGLLYDIAMFPASLESYGSNPPLSSLSTVMSNLTFPVTAIPPEARGKSLRAFDFNIQQPHMLHYNLTVERQLPANMMLSLSYAGSRGINLMLVREGNPTRPSAKIDGRDFWTGNEPRLNPNWNDNDFKTAAGDSWYNSLQFTAQKRLSHGLQFQSSYTWGKVLDTTQGQQSGGEFNGTPTWGVDPNNLKLDKGPAEFDTRHSWTFNTLYQLPSPGLQGFGRVLHSWRLGTIVTVKSGPYFSPMLSGNRSRSKVGGSRADHPDLLPGRKPSDIILGDVNRYFDPTAFAIQPVGFLGTAGRNTLQGPRTANWDFSVSKDTAWAMLGESGRLEFRAEIFNLLNRANFRIPSGLTVYTADAGRAVTTPLPTAGQIQRTITASRQVQFGLKLIF